MKHKIILIILALVAVIIIAGCIPKETAISANEPAGEKVTPEETPEETKTPEGTPAERDDFGCWPSSCSLIPNDFGKNMCEDWKAGKKVQWPDCSLFSDHPPCFKLCEFEKKGTDRTTDLRNELPKNIDIVPVHPTPCKPNHGFDGYRTDESFVINPKNNKQMYVNVEFKGVYKSENGGKTWEFIGGNGLEAWPRQDNPEKPCYLEYMSMYIDPLNPTRILLPGGAAPGKLSDPMYKPGGLHESLDGGKSWHQLFQDNMNAYTLHVVTDPKNSNIIYVTTAALSQSNIYPINASVFFVKEGLVYQSRDGGKNWRELPTGFLPHARASRIFIDEKDSNHLLFGTIAIPPNAGGGTVLAEQMGILETKDGGQTWKSVAGLPSKYWGIHSFDVSKDLTHFFVYTQHSNDDEKNFYSLDGGKIFNEVPKPVNFARFDPHDLTGMHLFGFNIYAQPNDLFESLDGGKTWNAVGKLPKEVTNDNRISNIVWDSQDKNLIYLNGGNAYIWKSNDKGKNWEIILSLEKVERINET